WLAPGDWTLRSTPPDYRSLERPLTLQPGQALDLGDLSLAKLSADPGTIGIRLRSDSDTPPTVVWVMAGSPADHAGVLPGDVIVSVDGAAVKSWGDATVRIRGAPGTPVLLQLTRNGAPLTLTVVRA